MILNHAEGVIWKASSGKIAWTGVNHAKTAVATHMRRRMSFGEIQDGKHLFKEQTMLEIVKVTYDDVLKLGGYRDEQEQIRNQ